MTRTLACAALVAATLAAMPVLAAEDMPGITQDAIKIGQTNPYSGPTSAYSDNGLADQAYVKGINDSGGINGRKIDLISLDDGYSPPKTLEQTRKLVEEDGVAFIFRSLGTAPNSAIAKYLNDRNIPQLFIASGASKFNEPKTLPWSMAFLNYPTEAAIFARYVMATEPGAKIAVLYQNDDLGKDYLNGLVTALDDKAAAMIVAKESYEVTDPTVDSQIVSLQSSGAHVFMLFATVKAAVQSIRKSYDIGWRPTIFLPTISNSVGTILKPAGLDKAKGALSVSFVKDPTDPQWRDDKDVVAWNAWMDKELPHGDKSDSVNVQATITGALMAEVLKRCGNDLSRENIMREALSLKALSVPMLLPGITISTSPDDHRPIKSMQLQRFDGAQWVRFGPVLGG